MLPLTADDPRMVGEFRLHARLGSGGMGRVFPGHSPGGRAVAVKVVHPHLARDAAFVDRFRREVAAAQAVNGSYAAPVVDAGPDDDPPWLAIAYVAGPSPQDVVTAGSISGGPLPEDAVLKLAAGLAEALRVIHACGLVHRDLKPGNVLLADDGPRVIDFGIARALDGTVLTSAAAAARPDRGVHGQGPGAAGDAGRAVRGADGRRAPEDSPATFWPGDVAQLIRDHQAGLALEPRDSGPHSPATIRIVTTSRAGRTG